MRKYKFILLITVAILSWHFVDINTTRNIPSIKLSNSTLIASAQSFQGPGYVGFLTGALNKKNPVSTQWFEDIYSFSRGLLNLVLFVFLVYIALRNILNIGVESYAIKKMLPKIVFAAFFGNLIRPIVTIASRIVDSILLSQVTIFHTPTAWSWYSVTTGTPFVLIGGIATGVGGLLTLIFAPYAAAPYALVALVFSVVVNVLLVGGMLMISLFHSLAPWLVLLATAIGPIAIGLSILPETEGLFKKWLKIIAFWLVFPLILNAVHYIIGIIPSMYGAKGNGLLSDVISLLFPLLLKIGLFALAVRIPFTWEKDVGGLIAALPQTVSNTADKTIQGVKKVANTTGRAVIAGRDWETRIRGRVQDNAAAKASKPARIDANTRFENIVGTRTDGTGTADISRATIGNKDNKDVRNAVANTLLDIVKDDDHVVERQKIFGQSGASWPKMLALYQRHLSGELATSTKAEDVAAQSFFSDPSNKRRVLRKSKVDFIRNTEGDAMMKASVAADWDVQDGWKSKTNPNEGRRFVVARGLQKWSVASLANNWAAREELYQSELKKSGFRFDYLGRKVAGPVADVKSQTERKAGDFSQLKSSEKVESQMAYTLRKIASILQADMSKRAGSPVSRSSAATYLMRKAEALDEAAESTFTYNASFLGKQGGGQKIDSNDLGTLIAGHNRMRDLAAQEARSYRPIEEQRYLSDQRLSEAYNRAASGASAVTGNVISDTDNISSVQTNRDFIPVGTRQIIESLDKIEDRIASLSGTNALTALDDQFRDARFENVTIEDYNGFAGDNEGIVQEISRSVASKTDQPTADNFVNQLKLSHGLSTGEMMRQAGQFGDPEISKMVLDYNKRQKMELVVLSKTEEARTLEGQAEQFVTKASANPQVVGQIKSAIEVYLKELNGNQNISPSEITGAKQFLATQAGLSDANTLTQGMISNLAQTMQATTIRRPTPLGG